MSLLGRLFGQKAQPAPKDQPGFYQGKHYTEYVEPIKAMKRHGNYAEAEALLLHLCDATEAEMRAEGYPPAPWYFEELGKIYRRNKDYAAEVAILERYIRLAPRATEYDVIRDRLQKAKELLAKKK